MGGLDAQLPLDDERACADTAAGGRLLDDEDKVVAGGGHARVSLAPGLLADIAHGRQDAQHVEEPAPVVGPLQRPHRVPRRQRRRHLGRDEADGEQRRRRCRPRSCAGAGACRGWKGRGDCAGWWRWWRWLW